MMAKRAEELAGVFLEENGKVNKYPFTNGKIFRFCEEIGKDFFSLEDKDFITFFLKYVKINSVATMDAYRATFSKFYQWCIDGGYTGNRNIFEESVYLDPDTLADYMAKECPVYYFQEEDIDYLCRKTGGDLLAESLIRLFYEGAASYDEIIYLKREQIDFDGSRISFLNRSMRISPELSRLLYEISQETFYLEDAYGRKICHLKEGEVFCYNVSNDTEKNRKQFLKRKLDAVSQKCGRKVTSKLLYQSGLFHKLKAACKDEDELITMLYENKRLKVSFKLKGLLEENGYPLTVSRVRYMFKPYMLQLIATRQ